MSSTDEKVEYLRFLNSENNFNHHRYDKEMLQYEYVRRGDMRASEESRKILFSGETGHLSDDPLKNMLYLCICNITLVTRFAIEGGMEPEKAYNASDIYIRKYDCARSIDELITIHDEMIGYFVKAVTAAKKKNPFPRHIIKCMEYINSHLHEKISCAELAVTVGLNSSYLSSSFRRETGMTISSYITEKRIEAAENLLRSSDYSLTDISDFLNFSSYSHFARTFRKLRGCSPREYREESFRQTGLRQLR